MVYSLDLGWAAHADSRQAGVWGFGPAGLRLVRELAGGSRVRSFSCLCPSPIIKPALASQCAAQGQHACTAVCRDQGSLSAVAP